MELTSHLLLNAYSRGFFPMADDDGQIHWYDPDPRAILPLDQFHIPKRLARTVQQARFEIRADTAFQTVMEQCARPNRDRESTWINQEIIAVYTQLYDLGFAHSVEAWQDDQLVGGLYGVSLQGLFAGESMFSHRQDASKVALVHLVERLKRGRFVLLDTQFITPHLEQFGVIEISQAEYKRRLAVALTISAKF